MEKIECARNGLVHQFTRAWRDELRLSFSSVAWSVMPQRLLSTSVAGSVYSSWCEYRDIRETAVAFPDHVVIRHFTTRNPAHVLDGLGGNRQSFKLLLRDGIVNSIEIALNVGFGQHGITLPQIPIHNKMNVHKRRSSSA